MLHKRRYILISIAAVIVVAAIVTVLLIALTHHTATSSVATTTLKNDPTKDSPAVQESDTKPDLSKDLGACTVITKVVVASAVSSEIKTVGDAVNRGYAKDSTGAESQTCTFAFTSDDTLSNRYSTTVTVFSTDDALAASKAAYVDMAKVTGVGDVAYCELVSNTASPGTPALNAYDVYIFHGSKLYTLTITQPSDNDVFKGDSAQTALTTIAKSISF